MTWQSLRAGARSFKHTVLPFVKRRPRVEARPGDEVIARLVADSPRSASALAWLPDKRFLISSDGRSALIYAASGDYLVVMGDPIGLAGNERELIRRFSEEAQAAGVSAAFYEVGGDWSRVLSDAGYHLMLIGEEAVVELDRLSRDLLGAAWRDLRYVKRFWETGRASFRVIEGGETDALLPELRAISDEWLAAKHAAEKGFSLGWFDESYLRRFPIALLAEEGRVTAFCNLWSGRLGGEFSADLMRHRSDARRDAMTYLFVKCMEWGARNGYKRFNMGMAPLSGMQPERSLWEKAGGFVYRHGEHFYNFRGLRHFKEKFNPVWQPRYLACRSRADLPFLIPQLIWLVSHSPRQAHEQRQAQE